MGIGGWLSWCGIAVWGGVLALHDVRYRRLPDALTLPPALAAVLACAVQPMLLLGLVWPALYLVAGRGVGGGDVKLAAPLGVVCSAVGGFVAVLAAIVLAGAFTVLAAVLTRQRAVAHGPSMLVAAGAVSLVSPWLATPFGV